MKKMKRIAALLLSAVCIFAMTACGKTGTGSNQGGPSASTEEALQVSAPVTIEFWHTLSADGATALDEMVAEFNKSNQYGITVNATYQGGYYDVLSKTIASHGTDTAPTIVLIGAGGIEQLADAGAVADMSKYVERDNYDLSNFPESLRYYMEHYDGQVIEFPYLVSTAVIYYNKALMTTEPTTLEEWISISESITKANSGVYGMGMQLDTGFIQRPILKSLGAPGLTTADGEGPATLDDGTLEKYLTDWQKWITDGHCMGISVTDSGSQMTNKFANGQLASFCSSTANMENMKKLAKENGIDLGVAKMVGYGGYHAAIGGGGLSVLSSATQQEKAAAWEFLKFLFEDENVIKLHKSSSYLPFTNSASASADLATYWGENPGYKVATEQLEWATYNEWSIYLSEWRQQVGNCFTAVLVDGSMTPQEAVEYLRTQVPVIFQ